MPEEFAAVLGSGGFDLTHSDHSLPSIDGLSALNVAKAICAEVQFILISGTLGEERAIEALECSATDCVLKQRLELAAVVANDGRGFELETTAGGAKEPARVSPSPQR